MFSNLRPNSQIYILYKDASPRLDVGSVVSVSMPVPKYPIQPMFGQPQEMVVDITVKVNNQDVTYQKIPANLDIADFNNSNIVLSDSREAMISSVDFHKEMITCFDRILTELNPELAEKQQQQSEINSLKNQVGEMSKSITELMELNRELMLQLKKE